MKKIYNSPVTEQFHVKVSTAMLAGSDFSGVNNRLGDAGDGYAKGYGDEDNGYQGRSLWD